MIDDVAATAGPRLPVAHAMIVGDPALPVVLPRVVEAACLLVDARYGALRVLAPAGGPDEFIQVGQESAGGVSLDVPIRVRNEVFGNLRLAAPVSGEFSADDEALVTSLAGTAGIVIENALLLEELAEARADQQRMLLLEDRDRIARDLHDHVIQRLFAAGLTLQGLAAGLDGAAAEKIARVVDGIDETIAQIRTSIFGLRGQLGPRAGIVRSRVLEVVAEVAPLFAVEPLVRLIGPLDSSVPDELVDETVGVVREALSDVARRSPAGEIQLVLSASAAELTVEVVEAGVDRHLRRTIPLR